MPTRVKLLMSEPHRFSGRAMAALERFAEVRVPGGEDYESLEQAAAWAEALWVRLRHPVDARLMQAASRLRAIVTPTTGLNHIDLDEAARRGIAVLSLRGETEFLRQVRATAELTIALMLSLLRRLPGALAHARQGGRDRDLFRGNELAGMTVGVVGHGRLGTLVTRYLQAFDAQVLVADPAVAAAALPAGVELVRLPELLSRASMVSLHVNLCGETAGFFGAAEFAAMRPGSWFVNTARGELVDERALLAALDAGQLAGAAVDVLHDEQTRPGSEQPLLQYAQRHANLLVTPHIGGCTEESMEKTELFMTAKLEKLANIWEEAGADRTTAAPAGLGAR